MSTLTQVQWHPITVAPGSGGPWCTTHGSVTNVDPTATQQNPNTHNLNLTATQRNLNPCQRLPDRLTTPTHIHRHLPGANMSTLTRFR